MMPQAAKISASVALGKAFYQSRSVGLQNERYYPFGFVAM
jgi:hypothetical protein